MWGNASNPGLSWRYEAPILHRVGVIQSFRDRSSYGQNGAQVGGFLRRLNMLDGDSWSALEQAAANVPTDRFGGPQAEIVRDALAVVGGTADYGVTFRLDQAVQVSFGGSVLRDLASGRNAAESAAWIVWYGERPPPEPVNDGFERRDRARRATDAAKVVVALLQLRPLLDAREWALLWSPFTSILGPAERL